MQSHAILSKFGLKIFISRVDLKKVAIYIEGRWGHLREDSDATPSPPPYNRLYKFVDGKTSLLALKVLFGWDRVCITFESPVTKPSQSQCRPE